MIIDQNISKLFVAYSCDEELTCHGNGVCDSNGNCVCYNGFAGLDCFIVTGKRRKIFIS